MICPSKLCRSEIPDDSFFCDQCGIKILRCKKCGAIGISKFCGKCGGAMVFTGDSVNIDILGGVEKKPAIIDEKPEITGTVDIPKIPETPISSNGPVMDSQPAGTQIINLHTDPVLELCSSNGISMKPNNGDILGRVMGPFANVLGTIPVISSKHAQITLNNGQWFITDLHSTNKTYVNDKQAVPDVPVKLADKDVVVLANVSFVVRLS